MSRARGLAQALVVVAAAIGSATGANAQRPGRPMGGMPPGGMQGPRRAQLEDEVRRTFARAVKERVGLTDDQMVRLGPLTKRYEEQRRALQMEERTARIRLQAALLEANDADSAKVNQLVQQLLDIEKRRVGIAESEQKDLAGVMTPHQRARYLALQEQFRRRLEQLRPMAGGPFDAAATPRPPQPPR